MNKKFTLIELLVVVAIIGILMSILIPSLAKSREKSRQVVCVNNLKQQYNFGTLWSLDKDDRVLWGWRPSGGRFTYGLTWGGDEAPIGLGWAIAEDIISPSNGNIFLCPGKVLANNNKLTPGWYQEEMEILVSSESKLIGSENRIRSTYLANGGIQHLKQGPQIDLHSAETTGKVYTSGLGKRALFSDKAANHNDRQISSFSAGHVKNLSKKSFLPALEADSYDLFWENMDSQY